MEATKASLSESIDQEKENVQQNGASDSPEIVSKDSFGPPRNEEKTGLKAAPEHEAADKSGVSTPAADSPFATPPQEFQTPSDEKENSIEKLELEPERDTKQVIAKDSANETSSVAGQVNGGAEETSDTQNQKRTSSPTHRRQRSSIHRHVSSASASSAHGVSEWSHQALAPTAESNTEEDDEDDGWQDMPAYASYDMYNDDGKLIAKEANYEAMGVDSDIRGDAAKGYTRVQIDEDAQSATSLDDNTAYLFKETTTALDDEDEESRDPLAQMDATKDLLTENQRIAYVGVVRLAMADMLKDIQLAERTRGTKKEIDVATEAMKMWSQKMMVRLYSHMELSSAEQVMIEQLADHGLVAADLTPTLMQNARVKNPMKDESKGPVEDHPPHEEGQAIPSDTKDDDNTKKEGRSMPSDTKDDDNTQNDTRSEQTTNLEDDTHESKMEQALEEDQGAVYDTLEPPPPYQEQPDQEAQEVRTLSQMPKTEKIDIDLRWTVLCDLFLILVLDAVYDARSRTLLEKVGSFMAVEWLDICRFEKRVTDALEMQEAANKEDWNEDAHLEARRKQLRKRRLVMMGLATVGGGLVIGLSAGLLAPVIGAGLAAGFTTIGVGGTSGFLAGAGGAAVIGTAATITGGTIGGRAANRRTGAVKTFEYRPLHNNKRVNLIVTVAGWMNGKVDDVRLPFSTVDPVMGDIYSVLWEPDMLTSMGDTINILATEALTQGLQQILGSTILITLMAALQLPIVLTKLSYLIDNPWSVSLARADLAGLILADSLIDRNLGARPITLVGFSLGSRVIFACLRELAKRGAIGLIQNVYLFGSPVVVKKDEYLRARTVVSGRFVNGYAANDWILGYLFRATSGGIWRVAGLAKVDIPGIENFDATEFVPGHMSYRKAMPRILREVGWLVESDEFTEIEDPDPENHERRQRELIDEIEEARQELQKKPEKRRFGLFRKNKKAEKKEWETYDERSQQGTADGEGSDPNGTAIFDVEAIRREAVEIAAEGMEIKELKSTMPTLVVDTSKLPPPYKESELLSVRPNIKALRETKSYSMNGEASPANGEKARALSMGNLSNSHDQAHQDDPGNGEEVTMSFEPSPVTPIAPTAQRLSPSPSQTPEIHSATTNSSSYSSKPKTPDLPDARTKRSNHASKPSYADQVPVAIHHNIWASEDEEEDFGAEKEVELTFE